MLGVCSTIIDAARVATNPGGEGRGETGKDDGGKHNGERMGVDGCSLGANEGMEEVGA